MYLITGASGHVGAALVAHLRAAGQPVRALARRASAQVWPEGVEPVDIDLSDPALARSPVLRHALRGVQGVFLFTPLQGPGDIAALAQQAGVRRAVLLSSIATQKADPRINPIAARHLAAERALAASGLPATVLRPDTFASNALDWAQMVRQTGVVRVPYPESLRAPVHERDLAEAAARALTTEGWTGQAWWLTGPQLLSQAQQVEAISRAIGRPVRVEALDDAQALAQWGGRLPEAAAHRLLDYLRKSIEHPPALSAQLALVLGRDPLDFEQWALDHRADFGG